MSKLNEAKALVDELNRKAGEQSILLKTKQDEADAALQEITISMQVMLMASANVQEMGKACLPGHLPGKNTAFAHRDLKLLPSQICSIVYLSFYGVLTQCSQLTVCLLI